MTYHAELYDLTQSSEPIVVLGPFNTQDEACVAATDWQHEFMAVTEGGSL